MTVSFDIANAFIFPWGQVREVIKYFQMPPYPAIVHTPLSSRITSEGGA